LLESQLEQRLVELTRRRSGMAIKLMPTQAGIPDRLIILPPGRMYLIELKTDTGRLSPIQSELHRRMLAKGVRVVVLYGKEQLDNWFASLDKVAKD
jgi:hypothetical protein